MGNRIAFYFDEHVAFAIVHDFANAELMWSRPQQLGALGVTDEVHLANAGAQGRVLVTQDTDFLRLHASGVLHTGIVYAPQHTPIRTMIVFLTLVYEVLTPNDMVQHVEFVA